MDAHSEADRIRHTQAWQMPDQDGPFMHCSMCMQPHAQLAMQALPAPHCVWQTSIACPTPNWDPTGALDGCIRNACKCEFPTIAAAM